MDLLWLKQTIEEEKMIFEFMKNEIILKKIKKNEKKILIKTDKFQIKNISNKNYTKLISWIKEDNSDKNINFENLSEEWDFETDKVVPSHQILDDLYLKLIVKEPKNGYDL